MQSDMECGDLSPLSSCRGDHSGDKSPHFKSAGSSAPNESGT